MSNPYSPQARTLAELCGQYLRSPSGWGEDAAGALFATFDPPLTSTEQATYADLLLMARFGVSMTLAEWQRVKPDAAALKAYLGVASPTAAQTAAAAKSIIRVLAVIVRS